MADGTIKQVNPYSGATVWTVPRRGHRPLATPVATPTPIDPEDAGRLCAFCPQRYLETPPEKARLSRIEDAWQLRRRLPLSDVLAEPADFRRIPNLFEIVSYDYWHTNYGYRPDDEAREHASSYLDQPAGQEHVLGLLRQRLIGEGLPEAEWTTLSRADQLAAAVGFFAGCHDVIIARRHLIDGANTDDQLASSGTLSPAEHAAYLAFTLDALEGLYASNRYARYVAVFQNWLKPAGASFDHLHKQLVAIDDRSGRTQEELVRLRDNLNLYNEFAVDYAARQNLLVAENEHAVAFAGFGHRYPSFEVYSKSPQTYPWRQAEEEVRGMSDLVHAIHAATGPAVPCNEEWHHRPPDVDLPMPWRIVVKWRVSTLAGFEGGTKIYLNTIDPWNLRDRIVPRLEQLRGQGAVATDIAIGSECAGRPNSLRYNPNLHR